MSEQSGPITREQVERAIAKPRCIDYRELPRGWREWAPDYVIAAEADDDWDADDWDAEHAALTRWRDELAAAETPRKVAPFDVSALSSDLCVGEDGKVRLKTPAEDSPERLRERREALGWTTAYAGHWVPWFNHTDVERAECGRGVPAFVARYAAALSAEEARRAADGADRVIAAIGRPAPRFKVGDLDPALRETALAATRMLRCGKWPLSLPRVRELPGFDAWNSGPLTSTDWIAQLEALLAEPASPPAPEVVDVPQPAPLPKTLAHFYTIRALPEPHRVSWNMPTDGPQWVRVSDALWLHVDDLRAMLADIDAQQQPDPQPDLDEGWRIVSGDTAFAMPFGTIRECSGCGCLVSGGPTACLRCIDAQQGGAS